jgi:carboxylate-amine ligase
MCPRVEETLCLTALAQAIVAKLSLLHQANQSLQVYPTYLLDENKWRAMRYGIEGKLIDFEKGKEVPCSTLVEELLAWLDDVVDDLGSRTEVEYATTILRQGTSADRQLATYRQTDDFWAVVDQVVEETREGLE